MLRPAGLARVSREVVGRGGSLLLGSHRSHAAELEGLETLDWVARRVASAALPRQTPFDFGAIARRLAPDLTRVNYAVQRVLYELAENLARGGSMPHALGDAIERARRDVSVAVLLARSP